jgi:hypothetical protein
VVKAKLTNLQMAIQVGPGLHQQRTLTAVSSEDALVAAAPAAHGMCPSCVAAAASN